jgi:hypothetical protein
MQKSKSQVRRKAIQSSEPVKITGVEGVFTDPEPTQVSPVPVTPEESEEGTTIVRIRTQNAKQKFPVRLSPDVAPTMISSEGHILELDTTNPLHEKLLKHIRNRRDYGSAFRELVKGSEQTELTDAASSLDQLVGMDPAAIWAQFQPHELNHFGLSTNSSKNELIAAFLQLKKQL